MRRRIIGALGVLGLCAGLGVVLAATGLLEQAGAVLKELSVRESEAHESFFDAVWDGNVWLPGGQKVFKAAAPEGKAALVKGVGLALKAYTRTPVFRQRYAEAWDSNQPRPAERPKSAADINKESDDSIKQMEESIKTMPPDMQKQMAEMVKQMKAQQEAMRKDTKTQGMLDSMAKQQEAENARRHEAALKEYALKHPKDPDAMIAARLKDFLALSADVNFDAKLVKSGGLMRFENEAFESKPPEWKLCYRAGKEATAAARTFAQEWLKELGAK
jgi:flagellar biosynthesis GTPase FlhF